MHILPPFKLTKIKSIVVNESWNNDKHRENEVVLLFLKANCYPLKESKKYTVLQQSSSV